MTGEIEPEFWHRVQRRHLQTERKFRRTKWPPGGVVSYQRVSTKGQDFPQQKRARDKWLAKHPEYELLMMKEDLMSGRKKNRFDWFINAGSISSGHGVAG